MSPSVHPKEVHFLNTPLSSLAACCLVTCLAQNAGAASLIVNGDFETTTLGSDKQLGYNTVATGWATTGYNFIFSPGAADTTGATGSYGALSLWGSNNGGTIVLPLTSPSGGNYIAADGAFGVDPISQTVSGLTVGASYDLSFSWAAAQQSGFDGDTTDTWQVSLGGQTINTSTISLPSHGFIGWISETFTFTADSVSPVLSFLSIGTPNGVPPFALLDGVTLQPHEGPVVPEPSACLVGALMFGGLVLRRQRGKATRA